MMQRVGVYMNTYIYVIEYNEVTARMVEKHHKTYTAVRLLYRSSQSLDHCCLLFTV